MATPARARLGGVTVVGDAAQVWQDGRQVGNVYRYRLSGVDGDWTAEAQKYRLTEDWGVGESEFRFFVEVGGKVALELHGTGQFFGEMTADGAVHRDTVKLKGTRLTLTA